MKPLEGSYDRNRLVQIPDVEQWFKNKATSNSVKQRKLIYLAMLLISFGCAIFYVGHKNYVYNERFYEYKSVGVIKADEPLNIFTHWKNYIIESNREKRDAKNREVLARRVPVFKLMGEYVGESFVEEVDGGKRVYTDVLSRTISHSGNNGLEFIGLFLALLGLLLAVFEPRLSKVNN